MRKKTKNLFVLVLVLSLTAVSLGEWLTWTGAAGDNLLSTPQNYNQTVDPYAQWTTAIAAGDVLAIASSANVKVDMFEDVTAGRVTVGDTSSAVNASLVLNEFSSLTLTGVSNIGMIIGRNGSTGTVTVSENSSLSISAGALNIGNVAGALATLNVYDTVFVAGAINASWGGGTAQINMYNGQLQTNSYLAVAAGSNLNLEEGKVLIKTGWQLIQPAIDDDRITAYGGTGNVVVSYVDIGGVQYMELTGVVPEPATISLIGLGSLFFLRKKR